MGTSIRWQLTDKHSDVSPIEMCIPLFSLARWQLFTQLVTAMPAVMVTDTQVPFQYIMDLENESDSLAIIAEGLRQWRAEGRLKDYVDDIVCLLISISDPTSVSMSRSIIETWEMRNEIEYEVDDTDRSTDMGLRQLIYNYAMWNLTVDECKTILDDIRRANIEFKKKLLESAAVPHTEKQSPRQRQWLGLWKKPTKKGLKEQ